MNQKARPFYLGGLACYFLLIGVIICWSLWKGAISALPFVVLFKLVPLAFPLKGLVNGKPYTFAWTSFISLYFFMIGVFDAADEKTFAYGLTVTLLSLGLFCFSITFARIQGKVNKLEIETPSVAQKNESEVSSDQDSMKSDEQGQTLPWTPMIIGAFCLSPASVWLSANYANGSYGVMLLLPFVFYFCAIFLGFFVSFAVKLATHGKSGFSSIEFIVWLNRFAFLSGFYVTAHYVFQQLSR